MLDSVQRPEARDAKPEEPQSERLPADRPVWEQPKLEEVSEQVMAQPYIRFT